MRDDLNYYQEFISFVESTGLDSSTFVSEYKFIFELISELVTLLGTRHLRFKEPLIVYGFKITEVWNDLSHPGNIKFLSYSEFYENLVEFSIPKSRNFIVCLINVIRDYE